MSFASYLPYSFYILPVLAPKLDLKKHFPPFQYFNKNGLQSSSKCDTIDIDTY